MAYKPAIIAEPTRITTENLVQYLQGELTKISGNLQLVEEGRGQVFSTVPAKPRDGQVAYADGVTWNPGFGAGPYVYRNSQWVPMTAERRNIILGGDFTLNPWQRGTTFAAAATGSYTADRFALLNTSAAVVTVQRATSAPTLTQTLGYYTRHALEVLVTTADAAVAAGDYFLIGTKLEGNILQPTGIGQSQNNVLSFSFWVSSPKTGIHTVVFLNGAANRAYRKEYTVSAANTWELVSMTIPVDTGGTWTLDAGAIGMQIYWCLMAGTTYQGSVDAWSNVGAFASASQVNCLDAINNSFKVALVDLRMGPPPPRYEEVNKDTEYHGLRRYYRRWSFGTIGDVIANGQCFAANGAVFVGIGDNTSTMRGLPTVASSGFGFFAVTNAAYAAVAATALLAPAAVNSGGVISLGIVTAGGLVAGDATQLIALVANAAFTASAEL